jgi:two-component system, chemotaxis family, response regulator Rcp1
MYINSHVAEDGVEATAFLNREGKYADVSRPDLILLDLNLPEKSRRDNCYITKRVDLDGFMKVVKSIDQFWRSIVKLPYEPR